MAEASISVLTGLGFSPALAERALQLEGGDVQRAADLLLTNPPPLQSEPVVIDDDAAVVSSCRVSQGQHLPVADGSTSSGDVALSHLVAMGFDARVAAEALRRAQNDLEAAMENLLSPAQLRESAADVDVFSESQGAHVNVSSDLTGIASPSKPSRAHEYSQSLRTAENLTRNCAKSRFKDRDDEVRTDNAKPSSSALSRSQSASSLEKIPKSSSEASSAGKSHDAYTVAHVSSDLVFGAAAFEKVRHGGSPNQALDTRSSPKVNVKKMVEASVDGVKNMKGQRGELYVTQMLASCYNQGLWMHGPPSSPVNCQVIPAMHHIFAEFDKLAPKDSKRVNAFTALANACQDCQQVQAREILRIFGDLTAQTETFEGQLRYSLVRQKEAALDRYITRQHRNCDKDHRVVSPWQQRAHLISGYVVLIGDKFGLDGMVAAQSDRFLPQVQGEIGLTSAEAVMAELRRELCPKEWLQTLLADINNQTDGSERLIDRNCIFKWVEANMSSEAAHMVFYDKERAYEFEDLDPKKPTDENCYNPFLSPKVLVDMLLKTGMLEKASSSRKKFKFW